MIKLFLTLVSPCLFKELEEETDNLERNLEAETEARGNLERVVEEERVARDNLTRDLGTERAARANLTEDLEAEREARTELEASVHHLSSVLSSKSFVSIPNSHI